MYKPWVGTWVVARQLNRLSARRVATVTGKGYYADGGGLYLQVAASGSKSWIFRYERGGKVRDMGMGPTHTITLAQARVAATDARRALLSGTDPLDARRATMAAKAGVLTFDQAAAAYITAQAPGWTNPKHAAQWASTLATYASPTIGTKPVDQIDTNDVLALLRPIWESKTETATRVRQRVESVLDAQYAQHRWDKQNPARWRGHLAKLLPKPSKVSNVRHFPALPYADLPAFMVRLRADSCVAAYALQFLIFTAARTNMVSKASWPEIHGNLWRVPAARMKGKTEDFEIPLAPAALDLLESVPHVKGSGPAIFTGDRGLKAHMSNGAMDALLQRMGMAHITVHGFRSTFKDWAAEQTDFANEVSEAAMAHVIADKTEA
ncbi:MAG: integrase arm-type DNA-binding domain-containing protein, partial [Rhodanobacter sp.]